MKYCTNCGGENPDTSLFCMSCGTRFPKIISESSFSPKLETPSPYTYSSPGTAYHDKSREDLKPVRVKYASLLNHSSYDWLVTGSIFFALSPIIGMIVGLFFTEADDIYGAILSNLVGLICFGLFIYGIYAIRQIEPKSINNQLTNVPAAFIIYLILNFFSSILFLNVPNIQPESSFDEVRNIVGQGMAIVVLMLISSIFLLYGSLKFTEWFEKFVTILRAPYNAHTNRLKWFGITSLLGTGLLVLAFLFLQSGMDSLSVSSVETAQAFVALATLILLANVVLQVAAGYKIYSVLKNIRKGKYDGIYQQKILNQYERSY